MLHPRGLGPILLGLRCQFPGDWSQRKATFTSESDSNTFTGKKIQYHLSCYFFSLTTDINRVSQNPLVPAALPKPIWIDSLSGVRIFFFASGCKSITFISRQWLLWRKVTSVKCGSSSQYKHNFEWASVLWFCGSANNCILSHSKDDVVGQHLLLFFMAF